MSTTTDTAAGDDAGRRDALADRLFKSLIKANDLAGWFAAVPEVKARLEAPGARSLDVGCGIGWSSISLAKAFPSLRVEGIDPDEASIAEAERLAAEAGVGGQVRFRVADAAELGATGEGGYDAAFIFEALHDMARPVEARGPGRYPRPAGRRRGPGHGRREGGRHLHRPRRRGRAAQLRLQLLALPAGQPGRDPVGGRRHRPALCHGARVVRPGRLRPASRCCPSTTCSGASTG